MGERRWITVGETAQLLSLSASGVRKMLNRGLIPCTRLGRVVRIDLRELERRLEDQAEGRRPR
jgi:excisionase family DNA binding protein